MGAKIFETLYVFILYLHLIDCITGNRIQYKIVFTLSSEVITPLSSHFQCCFEKSSDILNLGLCMTCFLSLKIWIISCLSVVL